MELIDRYIYAVGKRLPKSSRIDIEKELRSLIFDMLEAKAAGQEASDADIIEVLKELGEPSKVAANYTKGVKYLIGPGLFDLYFRIIKIVLTVVLLGVSISLAVNVFIEGKEVGKSILEYFRTMYSSGIGAVGMITIVFAIIENKSLGTRTFEDKFDPTKLPEIPKDKDKLNYGDIIVSIIFTVIAIMFFNYYAKNFPIYLNDGQYTNLRLFDTEAIASFLPLWNIVWISDIIAKSYILTAGKQTIVTRILDIIFKVASIVVIGVMLNGRSIFSSSLSVVKISVDKFTNLWEVLDYCYRMGLKVAIIVAFIVIAIKIFKRIKQKIK